MSVGGGEIEMVKGKGLTGEGRGESPRVSSEWRRDFEKSLRENPV